MDNIPRKTLVILLLTYVIVLVVLFIFSVLTYHGVYVKADAGGFSAEGKFKYALSVQEDFGKLNSFVKTPGILIPYKLRWILYNTVILFSRYFLVIHFTGVLLCYSLIFPYQYDVQRSKIPFVNLISKNIILFLFLTVGFIGLHEGAAPVLKNKQEEQVARTGIAIDLFRKGYDGMLSDNYSEANNYFSSYLELDGENKVIGEAKDWISAHMKILSKKRKSGNADNNVEKALDLYSRADAFFTGEKYFSAYYYAFLSSETEDEDLKEKALRLMAESGREIATLRSVAADEKKSRYYTEKLNALNDLKNGDSFKAYYAFRNLYHDFPGDDDLKDFYLKSKEAVEQSYFFVDEIKKYSSFPGTTDIVYLNPKTDGVTALVKIGKFIDAEEGRYFFNVEILEYDSDGEIITHFTAPYGKLSSDGFINMKAMERDKEKVYGPVYIAGTRNNREISAEKLIPNPDDLKLLRKNSVIFENLSAAALIRMWEVAEEFGYIKLPVESAILSSLLLPFSFFIFSLFSLSTGWFFKIRSRYIPWFAMLLIPLIPFILYKVMTVYFYISGIFYSFILFKTGFTITAAVLIGIQGLLLFLVLLAIAGQEK